MLFVDLRPLNIPGTKFAFFDTTSDRFLELQEIQTWECWGDFYHDFQCHYEPDDWHKSEQLKKLCPNWVFTEDD